MALLCNGIESQPKNYRKTKNEVDRFIGLEKRQQQQSCKFDVPRNRIERIKAKISLVIILESENCREC